MTPSFYSAQQLRTISFRESEERLYVEHVGRLRRRSWNRHHLQDVRRRHRERRNRDADVNAAKNIAVRHTLPDPGRRAKSSPGFLWNPGGQEPIVPDVSENVKQ
jgi:hypothetical protein